jgi:hypothetical protein
MPDKPPSNEDMAAAALAGLMTRLARGELRVKKLSIVEAATTKLVVECVDQEPARPLVDDEPEPVVEAISPPAPFVVGYRPPTQTDACRRCRARGTLRDGHGEWACTECGAVYDPTTPTT